MHLISFVLLSVLFDSRRSIAETSLTFPRLKVVIDTGLTQRPRQVVNGEILAAPLMQTIPSAQSTLDQRCGRVGRTCDGHYVALYRMDSPRIPHIEPATKLFPHVNLGYSLCKQLRLTQSSITVYFPGLGFSKGMEIGQLDDDHYRFPELGSKAWADAFSKSLELECSMDILLLAAFFKKITPPNRIVLPFFDKYRWLCLVVLIGGP